MKSIRKIFGRFLPPYKWRVVSNVGLNIFAAIFGAFSFAAMSPVLGILFNTEKLVENTVPFDYTLDSIIKNFQYLLSQQIIIHGEFRALIIVSVFLITMAFLKVGFTYLSQLVMVPVRNGVVRDMRNSMYKKILDLPMGYFSDERKGDIISRMSSDVSAVEESIMNSIDLLFKNPIQIIIYLGGMIYMSPSLTLFVFVMMPVALVIIGRIGRSLKNPSRKGQKTMGQIISALEESLSGLAIIKSFNAQEKMEYRFQKETQSYFESVGKVQRRRYLAHPVSEFLGTAIICIVLWYGGSLILNGEGGLSPQTFMTYLVFFYSIINPAKALSTAVYSIEKGMASLERVDEVMDAENVIQDGSQKEKTFAFDHEIEFRNVTFKYNKEVDEPILQNINLTIKKGQTIALVGQSGSGKTTMVNLLPRFWDIQEGEILIDGANVKDMSLNNLRDMIGYVSQEAILFNDTIANNIAFGVKSATQSQIEEAAKVANAYNFASESEHGFETNIGDRGSKLSGGQRQRLSIARAVLSNPPIMILDEATSALDTESERLVQDALDKLMLHRTSLVIAHRLSTIKNADIICVFKDGKIVERGTHTELLELKSEYSKLHNMQTF